MMVMDSRASIVLVDIALSTMRNGGRTCSITTNKNTVITVDMSCAVIATKQKCRKANNTITGSSIVRSVANRVIGVTLCSHENKNFSLWRV